MGLCSSCFGSDDDKSYSVGRSSDVRTGRYQEPDAETKRQLQAEAAEKRFQQAESRGVTDPERVKRQRKKQEEIDRAMMQAGPGNQEGGLRWTTG